MVSLKAENSGEVSLNGNICIEKNTLDFERLTSVPATKEKSCRICL